MLHVLCMRLATIELYNFHAYPWQVLPLIRTALIMKNKMSYWYLTLKLKHKHGWKNKIKHLMMRNGTSSFLDWASAFAFWRFTQAWILASSLWYLKLYILIIIGINWNTGWKEDNNGVQHALKTHWPEAAFAFFFFFPCISPRLWNTFPRIIACLKVSQALWDFLFLFSPRAPIWGSRIILCPKL